MGFLYDMAVNFMTEQRGIFVTVFLMPVSVVWDIMFALRSWLIMALYSAPELHKQRVQEASAQVRDATTNAPPGTKLCTARGGWLSISLSLRPYKKVATNISINMYDILELNETESYVHVEPMVNMGQLSHYLIPRGYTIPVLPEMDDLTVGGLFMGTGIEASSHKFGLFDEFVIEAEVILASGEVVTCSKTQNRDLFDALPWSYGTLGFLVSCKIKVIPCKPYIRIEYRGCHNKKQGLELFTKASCMDIPPDFVECIAYSSETMVVMTSDMVDEDAVEKDKINKIGRWYKPWYFKHVEKMLEISSPEKPHVEYIPVRQFFHRWTSAIFWELEQIIPFGNHPLYRALLGWFTPSVALLKLTQTEAIRKTYEEQHIVQDMLVPISKTSEALDVFDTHYQIYPLWICPYRQYDYSDATTEHRHFLRKPNKPNKEGYEMYVDLGAYGVPRPCLEKKPFDVIKSSRAVEKYVTEANGSQMLYATSYLSRDEFREMFNHAHYDKMKQKVDPNDFFPQVYEKVCKGAMNFWQAKAGDKKLD
ncbi:Delta24-sterol reductase [Hondaea fermentalgiana]|uniref:Delta(24)-sterol reductase n=1 Tax=Hondaea fermentalgiana TaxID=2315210 RepID=A0A2R5G974_9STRA|nr:Delta24-sterol reductase [Hondaea fermentalgiana]|eukprot:GBG27560.1 Delta24-sterol reductase [Hondaea fermentalgiana]